MKTQMQQPGTILFRGMSINFLIMTMAGVASKPTVPNRWQTEYRYQYVRAVPAGHFEHYRQQVMSSLFGGSPYRAPFLVLLLNT